MSTKKHGTPPQRSTFLAAAATRLRRRTSIHKAAPQDAVPILIRGATVHTVSGGTLENAPRCSSTDGVIQSRSARTGAGELASSGRRRHRRGRQARLPRLGLRREHARPHRDRERRHDRSTPSEAGSHQPRGVRRGRGQPRLVADPRRRAATACSRAGVMPQGGTVPGRLSVARLDGWTWERTWRSSATPGCS